MTKMRDIVCHPVTGEIAELRDFADRGLIKFRKVKNWRGHNKPAYFAEVETGECWQIGEIAYLSRTKTGEGNGREIQFNRHL